MFHTHQRFSHLFSSRGARGMGRFGKGFMDGGDMGGRAFGMGRKLASVDLQLLILGLLKEKPSHGYEIIKALDERSKGFYVPSPGMVYPALTYLEEIGYATVEADGARKLYRMTHLGAQHLESNQANAEALFTQFARVGERMDRVRRAMSADETGLNGGGDGEQGRSSELTRARRNLTLALAAHCNGSRDDVQRIAEILDRAAAEIAALPKA